MKNVFSTKKYFYTISALHLTFVRKALFSPSLPSIFSWLLRNVGSKDTMGLGGGVWGGLHLHQNGT